MPDKNLLLRCGKEARASVKKCHSQDFMDWYGVKAWMLRMLKFSFDWVWSGCLDWEKQGETAH